jgi:hypothetical protein
MIRQTFIKNLNDMTPNFTGKNLIENCAEFILIADKIDDTTGCLYLHTSLSILQVNTFAALIRKKLAAAVMT